MVKTSAVTDRRELHFSSMQDIQADIEYLDSGDPPRTSGNWTAGQIVQHVTTLIQLSIDGFPEARLALPLRILGRLMRGRILDNPLRSGLTFPKKFDFLAPTPGISWEEAVAYFSETMARLAAEKMTAVSPVTGRLSHEQWVQFHCRHAEMHFSFMHPE
jgi:hypothetical protein